VWPPQLPAARGHRFVVQPRYRLAACGHTPRAARCVFSHDGVSTGGLFSMAKRIRTAVFPVPGLGTRSLPATKAVPKEMLTIVDRPVIQHVVDEAKAAG